MVIKVLRCDRFDFVKKDNNEKIIIIISHHTKTAAIAAAEREEVEKSQNKPKTAQPIRI